MPNPRTEFGDEMLLLKNKCSNCWYKLFGNRFIYIQSKFLYSLENTAKFVESVLSERIAHKSDIFHFNSSMDQEPHVFHRTRRNWGVNLTLQVQIPYPSPPRLSSKPHYLKGLFASNALLPMHSPREWGGGGGVLKIRIDRRSIWLYRKKCFNPFNICVFCFFRLH